MKDIVYNFLENYLGDGFKVDVRDELDPNDNFELVRVAYIVSEKDFITIMALVYRRNCFGLTKSVPAIQYGQNIANTISDFFSIPITTGHAFVQNWFREKYNTPTIKEIDKLVKYKFERERDGL